MTNPRCGLAVIFCGFISLLIGRETINIPEILSGVHGFTGKTVRKPKTSVGFIADNGLTKWRPIEKTQSSLLFSNVGSQYFVSMATCSEGQRAMY